MSVASTMMEIGKDGISLFYKLDRAADRYINGYNPKGSDDDLSFAMKVNAVGGVVTGMVLILNDVGQTRDWDFLLKSSAYFAYVIGVAALPIATRKIISYVRHDKSSHSNKQ